MADSPFDAARTVARPHRADAGRNFDALLVAARDAFAEDGPQASLEDIARAAGVGIGTLYRNFPTRQDLFNSVFVEEVEQLCTVADEVAELAPWDALAAWLRRFADYAITKHAMREAVDRDSDLFQAARAAMFAAGEPLLARAQAAGAVRSDTTLDDVLRLTGGIGRGLFTSEAQRDRVLAMALDGIRARPAP